MSRRTKKARDVNGERRNFARRGCIRPGAGQILPFLDELVFALSMHCGRGRLSGGLQGGEILETNQGTAARPIFLRKSQGDQTSSDGVFFSVKSQTLISLVRMTGLSWFEVRERERECALYPNRTEISDRNQYAINRIEEIQ